MFFCVVHVPTSHRQNVGLKLDPPSPSPPHICAPPRPVISALRTSVSAPSRSLHSHDTAWVRAVTVPTWSAAASPEPPPCLSLCRPGHSPCCRATLLDRQSDDVPLPAWKPLTALRVKLEFLTMTFHTHCPGIRNSLQFPQMCQILSYLQNFPCTLPRAWVGLPCLLVLSEAGICMHYLCFLTPHSQYNLDSVLISAPGLPSTRPSIKEKEKQEKERENFPKIHILHQQARCPRFTNINSLFLPTALCPPEQQKVSKGRGSLFLLYFSSCFSGKIFFFALPIYPSLCNQRIPTFLKTLSSFSLLTPWSLPGWSHSLPRQLLCTRGGLFKLFSQL